MDVSNLAINPGWLFLAGCGLLTTLLMRRSFRYFGRRSVRSGGGPYLEKIARPRTIWEGSHHDVSAIIEKQKVELYDIARDTSGRLDSKMILLEQLITTSSRQIERMEKLVAQLEATSQIKARGERG